MAIRPWVKYSLFAIASVVLAFSALAGTGTYYFLRHLETKKVAETDAHERIDEIRKRFVGRAPMIEIVDVEKGDFRIQRLSHPEGRRADTIHVLTWTADDSRILSTDLPLWLMRFSTLNVLSHLGVAPQKFRLTVEDLQRFGPGIVADFKQPGKSHVLIWLE